MLCKKSVDSMFQLAPVTVGGTCWVLVAIKARIILLGKSRSFKC